MVRLQDRKLVGNQHLDACDEERSGVKRADSSTTQLSALQNRQISENGFER